MDLIENEEEILLNHEYDGIRELDNSLPPWWKNLFYITVSFSMIYAFGYEVSGWFSQPEEEYQNELAYYSSLEKGESSLAEDVNMEEVTDSESIARGETTYTQSCAICHGQKGEGSIGPNLTDEYWIHGKGDIEGIVQVIEDGVLEKGMVAWKSLLGKKKIFEVANYIMTLQKTNPPNAKAPEGDFYPSSEQNSQTIANTENSAHEVATVLVETPVNTETSFEKKEEEKKKSSIPNSPEIWINMKEEIAQAVVAELKTEMQKLHKETQEEIQNQILLLQQEILSNLQEKMEKEKDESAENGK